MMHKMMSRAEFLKFMVSTLVMLPLGGRFLRKAMAATGGAGFNGRPSSGSKGDYDLVTVKGDDPYAITVKAVESMGGMKRFVKKGSTVVVKPNIAWDRTPEQAANTNPEVVRALVELAYKAGAGRVNVFDITCNDARRCYVTSGIEEAAKAAGAKVFFADDWDMVKARFGRTSLMEGWPILRDAIDCATFINVPVLKDHGLTRLTLSMKNLMGVCGGQRGHIHRDIGPKLVDLTRFIKPDLTIIDAYRVLERNGPTGGSLADVRTLKTVMAGTDPVLVDTYAAQLVNVDPMVVPYIKSAAEQSYGSTDTAGAKKLSLEA